MEKVIQIIEVSKTYVIGDEIEIRALRGVSFTIERGEFVAIMGASGSGKSTLMNLIGCLDRPTSGRYMLEGVDVASLDEEELAAIRSRRIGFIFQNFNLLSRTSTLENVELPLFYSGWPADGAARAQSLVTMVGLNGRERNYPSQLSGGQQQRVAVARALINEPAILLADEPTGNLDSTNSAEILEMMTRLNRERGLTDNNRHARRGGGGVHRSDHHVPRRRDRFGHADEPRRRSSDGWPRRRTSTIRKRR